MNRKRANILLNCLLIAGAGTLCTRCAAQSADPQTVQSSSAQSVSTSTSSQALDPENGIFVDHQSIGDEPSNTIGKQFLKHLASDQKAIWTSPTHLRWSDGAWLFPLAAVTAGFFATDRAVAPVLSTDQNKLNRYVKVSDYGVYSLIGAGGGMYLWSKI